MAVCDNPLTTQIGQHGNHLSLLENLRKPEAALRVLLKPSITDAERRRTAGNVADSFAQGSASSHQFLGLLVECYAQSPQAAVI